MSFLLRAAVPFASALAVAGCAGPAIDSHFTRVQQEVHQRQLGADVRWLTTSQARREAQAELDEMLNEPIDADDAVRIALACSPALQALLFEGAAEAADNLQAARLPNPVFAFERMVRSDGGARELELTRSLSLSVLDLLLWPARAEQAEQRQESARLRLSAAVVRTAIEARMAWVQAVAAQEAFVYAQQVRMAGDARADLARRMVAAGNYSRLQQAREDAFAAEAAVQLARARQAAWAGRERLVRVLGLHEGEASRLHLPERLPDLPDKPQNEGEVSRAALGQRLDVRLAENELALLAREQGLTRVTGVVNGLELGVSQRRETGQGDQRGGALSFPLPVFDVGDASRARAQALYMAALNRTSQVAVNARSQVREHHNAYRTAYDVARRYRDEIVPQRQRIAQENLLRYNGMQISVFELLADAREQVATVVQALDAQRDFWLADAALQASLIGQPIPGPALVRDAEPARPAAGH